MKKNKRNVLQVRFPFDPALSDNRRLCWSPSGKRMFSADGYKRAKSSLAALVKLKAAQKKFNIDPSLPLCVGMTVCKPNARYDASNFIKPVNDAVSEALTGGNDSLFYGYYNWTIEKTFPRIEITIGQPK